VSLVLGPAEKETATEQRAQRDDRAQPETTGALARQCDGGREGRRRERGRRRETPRRAIDGRLRTRRRGPEYERRRRGARPLAGAAHLRRADGEDVDLVELERRAGRQVGAEDVLDDAARVEAVLADALDAVAPRELLEPQLELRLTRGLELRAQHALDVDEHL